jgi:hypothetical protein
METDLPKGNRTSRPDLSNKILEIGEFYYYIGCEADCLAFLSSRKMKSEEHQKKMSDYKSDMVRRENNSANEQAENWKNRLVFYWGRSPDGWGGGGAGTSPEYGPQYKTPSYRHMNGEERRRADLIDALHEGRISPQEYAEKW